MNSQEEDLLTDEELIQKHSLGQFSLVELTKHEVNMKIPKSKYNSGEVFPLHFVSVVKSSMHQNTGAPFLSTRPGCKDNRVMFWKRKETRGHYRGCQNWHFKKVSDTKNEYFIINEC